jgi:hypothetical protein
MQEVIEMKLEIPWKLVDQILLAEEAWNAIAREGQEDREVEFMRQVEMRYCVDLDVAVEGAVRRAECRWR